jgi:hypothetical protein
MTGGEGCTSGNCHGDAGDALSDPTKQRSHQGASRLLGENTKARQIAELYGIGAAGKTDPKRICMSCHATVDEASMTPIDEGVSCEACHGAAEEWRSPHQKGGNPKPGMRNLKDAKTRAKLCSDCHRITDVRLLSAGHPDGTKKDIVGSLTRLKHWPSKKVKRSGPYPELDAGAFKAAYDAIASGRPIPPHTVFTTPSSRSTAAAPRVAPPVTVPAPARSEEAPQPTQPTHPPPSAAATALSGAVAAIVAPSRATPAGPPRARQTSVPPRVPTTLPARATGGNVTLDLATPPPTDRLTTEELLLLVKERIARVHVSIRRANQ